jgi:16S rRNA A1518/A1519 N6-dimethyltransferase RsmA/KsgA/DIM1 with predicted DNA glycosylase/AP lyase activity
VNIVNENHALCGSPEWSEHIRDDVIRYMTAHADLGESMIEIGPGPGAATEWLRYEVRQLVAVELDVAAASALGDRTIRSIPPR